MLLQGSKAVAYVLMLLAMCCLGTWPNGFKMCAKDARVEQLYLSFALGFICVGIIAAFLFGNIGSTTPDFFQELTTASGLRIFFALLGGCILSCGNELYCFGSAHVGMTVALFLQGGTLLHRAGQPHQLPAGQRGPRSGLAVHWRGPVFRCCVLLHAGLHHSR